MTPQTPSRDTAEERARDAARAPRPQPKRARSEERDVAVRRAAEWMKRLSTPRRPR
jgi:hypothetical protein